MTSFRDYLAKRRDSKNPAGEFTRQAREEAEMEHIASWPQLRAYIYKKAHADKINDPIAAAEPVWNGYRAFVLKHRRRE